MAKAQKKKNNEPQKTRAVADIIDPPAPVVDTGPLADYVKKIEKENIALSKASDARAKVQARVKSIYSDARRAGLDTVTLRRVIDVRATPEEAHLRNEYVFKLYKSALGMQLSLDLRGAEDGGA